MPENIFKIYRPSGRGPRKGPGSWHNESEQDRFFHIKTELSRYCDKKNDYDYLDLVWHIKNAVVGDVFFSETVYQGVLSGNYWKKYYGTGTDQDEIFKGIMSRNTKLGNGVLDEKYMEIRKWLGNKYSGESLIFEHIIPAKVYIDKLIEVYDDGLFDIGFFQSFRKKIGVCIVTKWEDDQLNDCGFRESMPPGWDWDTGDPFDRYVAAGIKIHL